MNTPLKVNRPAPLRNVANFSMLMEKVVERPLDLPGLATFHGPSGYGKTKSAVAAANMYQAVYVECGQYTTGKALLTSILMELGIAKPRGSIAEMVAQAVRIMGGNIRRPIIIDEAHHIASSRFIDLVRELHDKSLAPIILIGEETLPAQLEAYERIHNRMLDWVAALPCNMADFLLLARHRCPGVEIAPDLANAILEQTRGNTRRIVVNLAKIEQEAINSGKSTVDLGTFGGAEAMIGSKAPTPRRAA